MILKPAPIFNAFNTIKNPGRVIYPCPDGKLLKHNLAKDLSAVIQADGIIALGEMNLAGLLKYKLGIDINFD